MEWLQRLLTVRLLRADDDDDGDDDDTAWQTVLPQQTLRWRVEVALDNEDGRHNADVCAFLAAVGADDVTAVWRSLFARLLVVPLLSRPDNDNDDDHDEKDTSGGDGKRHDDKDTTPSRPRACRRCRCGGVATMVAGAPRRVACAATSVTSAFVNTSSSNDNSTTTTSTRIPAGIVSTFDVSWTLSHEMAAALPQSSSQDARLVLHLQLSLLPPPPTAMTTTTSRNNNDDNDDDDEATASCAHRVLWRVLQRSSSSTTTMTASANDNSGHHHREGNDRRDGEQHSATAVVLATCCACCRDDDGDATGVSLCCCHARVRVQRVLTCTSSVRALGRDRVLVSCCVTNVTSPAAAATTSSTMTTTTDVDSTRRATDVVVVLQRGALDMHTTRVDDDDDNDSSDAAHAATAATATMTTQHHSMPHRRGACYRDMRAIDVLVERLVTVSPLLPPPPTRAAEAATTTTPPPPAYDDERAQVERLPLVLRAHESYVLQFVLQIVPQLSYLRDPHSLEYVYNKNAATTTAAAAAADAVASNNSNSSSNSDAMAVVHDRFGAVMSSAELQALLSSPYTTQLLVHYAVVYDDDADCQGDDAHDAHDDDDAGGGDKGTTRLPRRRRRLPRVVDHSNFPATLDAFVALLRTCDFYALDEEMTGITVQDERLFAEDITCTPEDNYYAKREAASRYAIIQVGICLFHRESSSSSSSSQQQVHYTARPFNFWLFPDDTDTTAPARDGASGDAHARDVTLNPSTLRFLRRHGMDFQAWVYKGVSFCDAAREAALRARLASEEDADASCGLPSSSGGGGGDNNDNESNNSEAASMPPPTTEAEVAWVEAVVTAATALQRRVDGVDDDNDTNNNSGNNNTDATHTHGRTPAPPPLPDVLEELQPPPPSNISRYAREYLTAQLRRRVPRVSATVRRHGSSAFTVLLTALSPSAQLRRDAAAALRRRRAEVDALGFRLVYTALVQSQKPLVGHNCMADLLFLMSALDAPLPPSLRAWKSHARASFPCVLDTRYVASKRDLFARHRFRSLHLGGLFDAYTLDSPRVRVTLPLGFQAYDPLTLLDKQRGSHSSSQHHSGSGGGGVAHEAGYDALMTGTVLLNLLAELGHVGDVAACPRELRNKVALFRSLYALDLDRDDGDEYTTDDVLDVRHAATMSSDYLAASMRAAAAAASSSGGSAGVADDVTLYSVDAQRTLAVLPPHVNAAALLQVLSASAHCTATLYQPRPSLPQTLAAAAAAATTTASSTTVSQVVHAATRHLTHALRK